MEDFKYCIWFIPEENHLWYTYTEGFNPHVTLYSHLEKEEAIEKISNIKECCKKVKIKGNIKQTNTNNFYALIYDIELEDKDNIPKWWPSDAHISFSYKYNKPFTDNKIQDVKDKVIKKDALLMKIVMMKCSEHYIHWK